MKRGTWIIDGYWPKMSHLQLAAGIIGRQELTTNTSTSDSGSINAGTAVFIRLNRYCFYPMVHMTGGSSNSHYIPHFQDGGDEPRFGLFRFGDNQTFDVDYRWVINS